jgi:hypothetical protein
LPIKIRLSIQHFKKDAYIIAGVAAVYFGVVLSRSAYNT